VGPNGRGIGESVGGSGALITDTCEVAARDVGVERAEAKTGVFFARSVAVERLVAVGGVGAVRGAAVERERAGGGIAAPDTGMGGAGPAIVERLIANGRVVVPCCIGI